MAPSVAQDTSTELPIHVKAFDEKVHSTYKYAGYLPVYDNTTLFPPTEPFDVIDKGTLADKSKPHLYVKASNLKQGAVLS